MKILHTADWHLGKRLDHYSRHEEQCAVLVEITGIVEQEAVDVVLIAGDLFDTFNPPAESTELFYRTLKRLSGDGQRVVIAIAGNHDSPDRIEAPDPLARACGILFAGYPDTQISLGGEDITVTKSEPGFLELQLNDYSYPLRLLLTPYANEFRLRKFLGIHDKEGSLRDLLESRWAYLAEQYCDPEGVNILMAHLFFMQKGGAIPEEPESERPIVHVGGAQAIYPEQIPEGIQYVALGHLHRPHSVRQEPCPMVYAGSPLAYSFSEAGYEKSVMLVDAEPGKPVSCRSIPLSQGKPLFRKRFEAVDTAIGWLKENPQALVELTIVTDQFLTAEDRKLLATAHNGIITIIPELRDPALVTGDAQRPIHPDQDIYTLFRDYFQSRHGVLPGEKMELLLKEALAAEEE